MGKNKKTNFDWLKNWAWLLIVALSIFVFYDQAKKKKEKEIVLLNSHLYQLHCDNSLLLSQKEECLQKIDSQNDPKWVELVLMKELGVVPNGYMKVYFKRNVE